jgi:hypothetical protein
VNSQAATQPARFALRPLEIKQLFDFTIRLYRLNFTALFTTMAIVQIPTTIAGTYVAFVLLQHLDQFEALAETGGSPFDMLPGMLDSLPLIAGVSLASMVYQLFALPFALLASSRLCIGSLLEQPVTLEQSLSFARQRYWPTQFALALFALPLLLLSLAVLVPVLLAQQAGNDGAVLGFAMFAISVIMLGGLATMLLYFRLYPALTGALQALEDPPPGSAYSQGLWYLTRSWQLTAGLFWRELGMLLLLMVAMYYANNTLSQTVDLLVTLGFSIASGLDMEGIVTSISETDPVATLVSIVVTGMLGLMLPPVAVCYQASLYIDLRCRKEAMDLLRLLDVSS